MQGLAASLMVLILAASSDSKPHDEKNKLAQKHSGTRSEPKYMSWNPSEERKDGDKELDVLCTNAVCPAGQRCKYGECLCGDSGFCGNRYHPVCGSDGILYPSHCELHRTACVLKKTIRINHSGRKCAKHHDVGDGKQHRHSMKKHERLHGKKKASEPRKTMDTGRVLKKDLGFQMKNKEKATTTLPSLKPKLYKLTTKTTTLAPHKENSDVTCDQDSYKLFKDKLLEYHCDRIGRDECKRTGGAKSPFLVNAMFNYYDKNYDNLLDKWELDYTQTRDHLQKLSSSCQLRDMLNFDDSRVANDYLDIDEFHLAFGVPNVYLEGPKVFHVIAVSDPSESVELKCDVVGATRIIWERNGVDLTTISQHDIKVSQNGMLFLSPVGLHHAGNFTCHDEVYPSVVQTHQLRVIMAPSVQVYPPTQYYHTGLDVAISCRADGIPAPKLQWQVNDFPIPDENKHYFKSENNASLQIRDVQDRPDTGVYKCLAVNEAGRAQDISTLFVTPKQVNSQPKSTEMFATFHSNGYTVVHAKDCVESFSLKSSDPIHSKGPKQETSTLCKSATCQWGPAVNVKNKFLYASQPSLNRVLVIDLTSTMQPVQILATELTPVQLHYEENMDQVWLMSWSSEDGTTGPNAVQVIRSASVGMFHSLIDIQALDHMFTDVKDLFVPPSSDIKHNFKYAYMTRRDVQTLVKVDMKTLAIVSSVDLAKYKCVPKHVAFIAIRGQIIVDCEPKDNTEFKLILDYITDSIIQTMDMHGQSFVTPDNRHFIRLQDEKHITVHKITDNGDLVYAFENWLTEPVDDVTFIASLHHNGYDLFASTHHASHLWYINLDNGKSDVIQGADAKAIGKHRLLESSWRFGEHIGIAGQKSLVIVNAHFNMRCQQRAVVNVHTIQWFLHTNN